MQERFWWPGMTQDLRNHIKKCSCCRKYEAAPPVMAMKPLACSGPGELLHVDFTSIEETVPLKEDPVIRNVLVLQDHFSKYVVAYVVMDQTACTAAETLRIGYFGLFAAPAYLVSDQGKVFTGHVITHLCELYRVQKLRTSPYHAQTGVSLSSLSWRTGLSTRSNVQLLMTGRNPNIGFSIGTAYCSSPMRMPLASQVKHRPRQPQQSQMPPRRLFQKEQCC